MAKNEELEVTQFLTELGGGPSSGKYVVVTLGVSL